MNLRRKAEGELRGVDAVLFDNVAIWAINELRGEVARLGDVGNDIAVVVIAR